MNAIWIWSIVLQWSFILVLSLLVLSLVRQVGALNIQLNALKENGAGVDPLAPHTQLIPHELTLVNGDKFHFGGSQKRPCLIAFFSPTCSACEALPGELKALRLLHPLTELDLVAVVSLEPQGIEHYLKAQSFEGIAVALRGDFPEHLVPHRGVPFGFSITTDGYVAARGRPKSLVHLREMAHAALHMAEMATTHSLRTHEWGESAPYWNPMEFDEKSNKTAIEVLS